MVERTATPQGLASPPPNSTQVLIVGGGPVGSALATELALRGIGCVVVEKEKQIPDIPVKAMYLSMRTMEHFRRWGAATTLRRAATTPRAWQYDMAFSTSLTGRELGVHRALGFRASDIGDIAAEPAQLVMQPTTTRALRERAAELGASFALGWECTAVAQRTEGAIVEVVETETGDRRTVEASFVVGCDGGGQSVVRDAAGITRTGPGALGMILLIHFWAPGILASPVITPAAFNAVYNPDVIGLGVPIDDEHWCLHVPGRALDEDISQIDKRQLVRDYVGPDVEFEITYAGAYKVHERIADTYQNGRIFIAGDAAHLYAPFGGHNMNSGLGDAVDLGWKLAATLQGWGGEGLLDSYTTERRPIALANASEGTRNVAQFVATAAKVLSTMTWDEIHARGPEAEARRRDHGETLWQGTIREFVSNGIGLDQRYRHSPVIIDDGTPEPPWDSTLYLPCARPGHRAPHARTLAGDSLYDKFGTGYTLLAFADADADTIQAFQEAAQASGVPLQVVHLDSDDERIRSLYAAPLVLIRPDQHVSWRGHEAAAQAPVVMDAARGAIASPVPA
jgi:2-polyprenyl-6-methoxyphenol hydroxylase-like FAD-dependent oxidoreductase